jgi:hypothetical protein
LVSGDEAARARLEGTRPLSFDGASDHDNRLLRTIFGCCFSETVALHVLAASQAAITLPAARRQNHRHLKEETRHARLGWALLGWDGVTARDRTMIETYVPEMTRLTRWAWLATQRPADEDLHALGFLSTHLVGAAFDEAFRDVIRPGLLHHGIRCASNERE